MHRALRALALTAAVTAAAATAPTTAHADTAPPAATSAAAIEHVLAASDAAVCTEGADALLRCYPSEDAYRAAEGLATGIGARDMYDCPSGYFCLWEWTEFGGDRVQYRTAGTKNLSSSWRDRGTSYYNRREAGGRLVDFRTAQPDPNLYFPSYGLHRDLGRQGYVHGGSWNNKTDRVVLS